MNVDSSSDDGAVLIWMAGFIFLMLSMGALAVDLGYGYVVRQRLSSTADAAALAGAQAAGREFKDPAVGGCGPQLQGLVVAAADVTSSANSPVGSTAETEIAVDCTDASGNPSVGLDVTSVVVTVTERTSLPTLFGRVLGVDALNPAASASARVFGGVEQTGLRPFTLCMTDELSTGPVPGRIYMTRFGYHRPAAVGGCQPTSAAGDWGYAGFDLGPVRTECLIINGYGSDCDGSAAGVDVGANGTTMAPVWPTPSAKRGDGVTGRINANEVVDEMESWLNRSLLLPVADAWTDVSPFAGAWTAVSVPTGRYSAYGAMPVILRGFAFPSATDPTDITPSDYNRYSTQCEQAPTCQELYGASVEGWDYVDLVIFWEFDDAWVGSFSGQDTTRQCALGSPTCAPILQLLE